MFTKKSFSGGGGGGARGGSRFGGGGSKPWERGGAGGRDSGRTPELHSATCDDCGQRCEVPFKPNGKKPVYCRACFAKQEGGDAGAGRFDGARSERPAYGEKRSFGAGDPYKDVLKEINGKLDVIIRSLDV